MDTLKHVDAIREQQSKAPLMVVKVKMGFNEKLQPLSVGQ